MPLHKHSLTLLTSLLLLGASSARADMAAHTWLVNREEIPDSVLRGIIGVATVYSFTPTHEVPRFEPEGKGFQRSGTLKLTETAALTGWSYESQELRDFPVVARRGSYIQIISDARTGEKAWLRIQEGGASTYLYVTVKWLEEGRNPEDWDLDLRFLLPPGEQLILHAAPSASAKEVKLTEDLLDAAWSFKVLDREGDFVQVGLEESPDEPVRPLGWVRMKDAKGTLRVWPALLPGC